MHEDLMLIGLLLVTGCAHAPPIPAHGDYPSAAHAARPRARMEPATCMRDLDCGDKQLCIRNQCIDISADLAECNHVRVLFPFNSCEVSSNEATALERSARCLKADRSLQVTIEGNADERGTEEYNLALGDRRASAIARYLDRLGVSPAQLRTVSYGKDNPLCLEHDEACWAKNRRAELTASPSSPTAPVHR